MSGQRRWINRKIAALALLPLLNACAATGFGLSPSPSVATVEASATPDYASIEVPERQAFLGQGPDFLNALMGPPSLRRKEAGAELWQYAGPTCVVLFYLYEEDGSLSIDHFDARARKSDAPALDETMCLKEVVALKETPALS